MSRISPDNGSPNIKANLPWLVLALNSSMQITSVRVFLLTSIELENNEIDVNVVEQEEVVEKTGVLSSEVYNIISSTDLNNITPMQAFKVLAELKELIDGD